MKLLPQNDWLIVRAIPEEKITATGIILPVKETDESAVMQGEVLFGNVPEFKDDMEYKPGDIILFSKFLPMDFKYKTGRKINEQTADGEVMMDEEKVWCIKDSDIIAKVE